VRNILKEPLVHFVLFGVVVFGAYLLFKAPVEATHKKDSIEITAEDVAQMVFAWRAQGRPELTQDQLQSLIDQKIAEEVLFREGIALGLDQNDEVIKRRIAQKMDFLAADIAELQELEKDELTEWYSAHKSEFALPPRASFRHLYFSPDKRGGAAKDDAATAKAAIQGRAPGTLELAGIADQFVLRSYYANTSPYQLLKEFGPGFAEELFELKPGDWSDPIRSGYGWHLVWVEKIEPGRIPTLDEVEDDVRMAWRNQRYQEIKKSALDEMLSRYEVSVPSLEAIDLPGLIATDRVNVLGSSSVQ
jgi:parvulin-like peptidyl-prolyl isomerase